MAEWRYFPINSQTTLQVASVACSLICVTVNKGAASALVQIFDGTNANGIDITAGGIDASAAGNFFFGNVCPNGLTVKQSGGSANVNFI